MAHLLLLRHGQSTWNAERRWQGTADPPLSPLGERQARAAAAALLSGSVPSLAGVVTSDLQRSRRTAEIIAGALGLPVIAVEPALRERDVGEWSGCTADEIAERWPGAIEAWREGRLDRPPGGEANTAFLGRILPAVDRLCAHPAAALLVVTHGGVIRMLERHLGGESHAPGNVCGRWLAPLDSIGSLQLGDRVALPEPPDAEPAREAGDAVTRL